MSGKAIIMKIINLLGAYGVLNFIFFLIFYSIIGGSALSGFIENEAYFVNDLGHHKQVSKIGWYFFRYYEISVLFTFPFAILAGILGYLVTADELDAKIKEAPKVPGSVLYKSNSFHIKNRAVGLGFQTSPKECTGKIYLVNKTDEDIKIYYTRELPKCGWLFTGESKYVECWEKAESVLVFRKNGYELRINYKLRIDSLKYSFNYKTEISYNGDTFNNCYEITITKADSHSKNNLKGTGLLIKNVNNPVPLI